MNIDELVNSIAEDEHRISLARWVDEWKKDDTDVHNLYRLIVKWHGNVWFQNQEKHDGFRSDLQAFKESAIDGLGGMTVNERLYWFGLFEAWDHADNQGQQRIRRKLDAPA